MNGWDSLIFCFYRTVGTRKRESWRQPCGIAAAAKNSRRRPPLFPSTSRFLSSEVPFRRALKMIPRWDPSCSLSRTPRVGDLRSRPRGPNSSSSARYDLSMRSMNLWFRFLLEDEDWFCLVIKDAIFDVHCCCFFAVILFC